MRLEELCCRAFILMLLPMLPVDMPLLIVDAAPFHFGLSFHFVQAIKYGLMAAKDAAKDADRKLKKKPSEVVFGDNAAIEARRSAKGLDTK